MKTENLIFAGSQYHGRDCTTLVFKSLDKDDFGSIVITFPWTNTMLPNVGSIMEVSYSMNDSGIYIGKSMKETDPGAYD